MTTKSITVRDLQVQRARGDIRIVVDVRSAEEFAEAHVEGAIHVPGARLVEAAREFDPTARFVTVCTKGGGRSQAAARALLEIGRDALFLEGGTLAWLDETRPS